GLDVIDAKSGRLLRSYNEVDGINDLKSNFFVCLYRTRAGTIYAGTSGGVYTYDVRSKKFNMVKGVPSVFTSCIYEDEAGDIWLGSYFSVIKSL
ncbi:MAG: hypothetical protein EOO89_14220, partial [Pedobacter sp.]